MLACLAALSLNAQVDVKYCVGVEANTGDKELTPHYMMSNHEGVFTQQHQALAYAGVTMRPAVDNKFTWRVGLSAYAGWASDATYRRYDVEKQTGVDNEQHPARAWIQTAYVQGRYRCLQATLGAKTERSEIVNHTLSSGDLVRSNNARPMMGLNAGFTQFENIPLTNGWVQIKGQVGYYRTGDDKWLENHHNNCNPFVTTDYWVNYKYVYFRTNPDKPFMVTGGMQAACQFGGEYTRYEEGRAIETLKQKADAEAFFKALLPSSGGNNPGDQYYEGNHLGTWDIALSYRLPSDHVLRAYYQSPWEDGSGIGKRNGFDGLWGLEYYNPYRAIVKEAVIEYIDLTNQSGPIHYAPGDHEGTTLTAEATGADNYYNNYAFNGWQSRGMAIGSPMALSPIYNRDGFIQFTDNLVRGVHLAVLGYISADWLYLVKAGYRKSWGTPTLPRAKALDLTSLLAQVQWEPQEKPFYISGTVALDRGSLGMGDNFGARISIGYRGNLTIGGK